VGFIQSDAIRSYYVDNAAKRAGAGMSESAVVVVPKNAKAEAWLDANFQMVEHAFRRIHQADPPNEPSSTHPHGLFLYRDGKDISPDFSKIFLVVPIPSGSSRHAKRSGSDVIRALETAGADLQDLLVDAPGHEIPFEVLKRSRKRITKENR